MHQAFRCAGIAALIAVSAAIGAAADLKICVVDIDKVSEQYKELTEEQAKLRAWASEREQYFNLLQDFIFLSADEFQEVARIYNVPKDQWSEEQKKREGELRGISAGNEKKYVDLQSKNPRTPEEQNQFSTLQDVGRGRENDLKLAYAEFQKQRQARVTEVQGKLKGNVQTVIETVAKEKGYTLVLDKSAVYFAVAPVDDVTDDVLKALNAGSPAPGAADAQPQPQPEPAPAPQPAPQ